VNPSEQLGRDIEICSFWRPRLNYVQARATSVDFEEQIVTAEVLLASDKMTCRVCMNKEIKTIQNLTNR
jgi:hypothetical protein